MGRGGYRELTADCGALVMGRSIGSELRRPSSN